MESRLLLLGVPGAVPAGDPSAPPGDVPVDKPASLLFYLARRADWVGRSELAFLYRPDAPERVALGNVRVLLHRARERLPAGLLDAEKGRVRYRVDTDVQAFERAVVEGAWSVAVELYRGPFLSGVAASDSPGYDTWLELERSDLARTFRSAALNRGRELLERGAPDAAAELLERVLHADPFDEEALQELLRALFAAARRGRARAVYRMFERTLRRELDSEPLESTRALLGELERRGGEEPAPAVEAPPERTHNLPAPTSRFVGRARELARLAELLTRPDVRLLTLVGLGGVGKTRLALELAGRQLGRYRDGVWFVPLAGVPSPELLGSSIAAAVGLKPVAARDPAEQLRDFLREKRLLLLLDNVEHLVEGAVQLEDLLAAAPGLVIVATSRTALGVRAERLFDLEGLASPSVDDPGPPLDFDAVRLFVDRAERRSADFVAQGATLAAVAELCRMVEGLPLALELAASWVRVLSVEQLLAEFGADLDRLSAELRDLPERHRSLATVLDHAWERLDAREREALAKLSRFRGPFTAQAAERVAGAHLALLLGLIDRTLVRRNHAGSYALHELVRQHAARRLGAAARRRLERDLRRHYLARLERAAPELRGARQGEVAAELTGELDNLRLALELAERDRAWQELGGALEGLHRLLLRANRFEEGCAVFGRIAAALAAEDAQPLLLARVRIRLGFMERNRGRFVEAATAFRAACAALRGSELRGELAFALHELGNAVRRTGDPVAAEAALSEALELAEEVDDPRLLSDTLFHLSLLRRDQGRTPEAWALLERCVELGARSGDGAHLASATGQLATLILQSGGDSAAARRHLQGSLAAFRRLGDEDETSIVLHNLGRLAYEEGDFDEAERLLRECLALRRHLGNPYVQESALATLGEIARERGLPAEARALFARSAEISRTLGSPLGEAYALADTAGIEHRLGDEAAARRAFGRSLEIARDAGVAAGALFELLLLSARFTAAAAPAATLPVARWLARQEGVSRHLRAGAEALERDLVGRAGAPDEVAACTEEEALARQLALLGSPGGAPRG